VHVGIDAAREDVASGGIDHLIAPIGTKVLANVGNPAVPAVDVAHPPLQGGADGAVPDEQSGR
jgi:hypothetical protein